MEKDPNVRSTRPPQTGTAHPNRKTDHYQRQDRTAARPFDRISTYFGPEGVNARPSAQPHTGTRSYQYDDGLAVSARTGHDPAQSSPAAARISDGSSPENKSAAARFAAGLSKLANARGFQPPPVWRPRNWAFPSLARQVEAAPEMERFSVIVPPGYSENMRLTVRSPSGQTVRVTIPTYMSAGAQFQVEVPVIRSQPTLRSGFRTLPAAINGVVGRAWKKGWAKDTDL